MLPTKEEANAMLVKAHEQNPGPWADHCRVAASVAETIAKECDMDSHRAYVSGLLHDIGRYEGVRGLHHVYAGYEAMKDKGYNQIARICLSHSFPSKDIDAYAGGDLDCTPVEMAVIESFISEVIFDDYDKLIQLCDAMSMAEGVCLIELRLFDGVRRYGFNDFTLRKWDAFFELKKYFSELCGKNVYDLFYDEIRDVCFR